MGIDRKKDTEKWWSLLHILFSGLNKMNTGVKKNAFLAEVQGNYINKDLKLLMFADSTPVQVFICWKIARVGFPIPITSWSAFSEGEIGWYGPSIVFENCPFPCVSNSKMRGSWWAEDVLGWDKPTVRKYRATIL